MATIDKIKELLIESYRRKNGYKLFFEVKRSSGYTKPERFADAVAVSLFPSNGISITGYEFKSSRADLLNDLRDLSKSEAVKQFCDYWILIVTDKEIIEGKIQVPDDWGIWCVWEWEDTSGNKHGGSSFRPLRKPKQLYPKPVDRYFLASLLNQRNWCVK